MGPIFCHCGKNCKPCPKFLKCGACDCAAKLKQVEEQNQRLRGKSFLSERNFYRDQCLKMRDRMLEQGYFADRKEGSGPFNHFLADIADYKLKSSEERK